MSTATETVTIDGTAYTLNAFCDLRLRRVRCTCGAGDLGHAPDCEWIRAGDDAAQEFGELWAEEREDLGARMWP